MKNSLIIGIVISAVFLTLLNCCFGSYFLGYESLFNAFGSHEFNFPIRVDLSTTAYRLIFPLASFLNVKLKTTLFFSIIIFALNLSAMSVLIGNIHFHLKQNKVEPLTQFLIILLILLAALPCQMLLHNHSISFLLGFTACLMIYTIKKNQLHKGFFVVVVGLLIASMMVRLELALLSTLICAVFTLTFNLNIKIWIFSITSICLFFVGLNQIAQNQHEFYGTIFSFEREIQDRKSLKLEELSLNERSRFQAMGKFVLDTVNYNLTDYSNYVESRNFVSYVSNKAAFLSAYKSKILDLSSELKLYVWYVFFSSLFVLFLLFEPHTETHNLKHRNIKFAGFVIFILLIPLTLSAFFTCSAQLVYVLCFCFIYTCLMYWVSLKDLKLPFVLILNLGLTVFSGIFVFEVLLVQKENSLFSTSLREEMAKSIAQNKTIVFANLLDFSYYPSRLFQTNQPTNLTHYYLDISILNYVKYFREHNMVFFEDSYFNLGDRLTKCANKNVVFYSTEEYNSFLTTYMKNIYQESFCLTLDSDSYIKGKINKYHLLREKCNKTEGLKTQP